MKEIKEYCERWQTRIMWISLVVYLIVFIALNALGDKTENLTINSFIALFLPLIPIITDLIGPSFFAGTLYFLGINYIRKTGWKRKFPQWDIGGQWNDNTTYRGYFDKEGKHLLEHSELPAAINIQQEYDSIVILDSEGISDNGEGFTWKSICALLTTENNAEGGTLHILYEVTYNEEAQKNGYPQSRQGYEKMKIILGNYDGKKPQKPTEMRGVFSHCVNKDGHRSYYGEVKYTR